MTTDVRRAVLTYACAFAVAGATPFLLLPVLTTYLSPQQFGEITSFLILAALLANLGGLSAHGFVSVRYFSTSASVFRSLVGNSLAVVAVAHVVLLVLVFMLFPLLHRSLGLSIGQVTLAVIAALFLSFNLVFLAIFQASNQPGLYLRARLLQGFVELSLCMALIFFVVADAQARTHSYTLALAASALLGGGYCLRQQRIGGPIAASQIKALLRFGVPMVPHIAAGTAITYLDRLVVSTLLGVESLGIYMVAMQIGMAMIALIEPLNKALVPWLFGQLSKNQASVKDMVVRRTYQLFAVLILLGVLVAGAAHLLFDQFIGPGFEEARSLIPWMVAGFVMQGFYYSQVNYLFYAEKTGMLSKISVSIALLGCLVSYTLTRAWGLTGAGASFLINNFLLFVLVWWAASRAVPMPWRLGGRGEST